MTANIKTTVILAETSMSSDIVVSDLSATRVSSEITSLYWSSDVAGNTPITTASVGDTVFLIAKVSSGAVDVHMRAAPLLALGVVDRLDSPTWDTSENKYSVDSGKAYMSYVIPELVGGVGTIFGSALCGWASKSAQNLVIL